MLNPSAVPRNALTSEASEGGRRQRLRVGTAHPSPVGLKPLTPPTAIAQDTAVRAVQELPRERPRPPPDAAAIKRRGQTAHEEGCPVNAKDGRGGEGETMLQRGGCHTGGANNH